MFTTIGDSIDVEVDQCFLLDGFPPIADIQLSRQLGRMIEPVHAPKDWNPVIHILDELSEGTHSVTELLYSSDHYNRRAYEDAMLYLASLPLIQFSRDAGSNVLAYRQAAELFQSAMLVGQEERGRFSEIDVDLTRCGQEVLSLLRLGHP